MPDLVPRSPVAPNSKPVAGGEALRTLAAGGVGAGAILALAGLGRADASGSVVAAILALGASAALAWRPRARTFETARAESPAGPPAPPFAATLEALPEPVLVVSAGDRDDQAARRIAFANAAARDLLRVSREGALLVAAVRRPEVLEAVDIALYERIASQTAFEAPGAQERFWRASALPLDAPSAPADEIGGAEPLSTGTGLLAADPPRFALLVFRDDTDARRAERTRVDFLANASHELRTPLASLSGFIETLRGHARDDPAARERFLGIMATQTDRMGRLTEDLLSLSRVELNEHVPPSGRCDLAMAVSDVVDALQPLLPERSLSIDLRLPRRGAALMVGERDQIVQVAQNLIANALKYSPRQGCVEVEVALADSPEIAAAAERTSPRGVASGRLSLLTPERAASRYVVLRVRDDGPGMQREHLPRLAERFYRIEGQKSGDRAGTGLGLAIVKHIVNRHRGGLVVESAPGKGSRFSVYFPALATREEPASSAL